MYYGRTSKRFHENEINTKIIYERLDDMLEYLTKLDEEATKKHPVLAYEGRVPADADEMDYVRIPTQKGTVIA